MSEQVVVKSVSGGKPWNDLVFYDIVFDRNGEEFACSWGKKSPGAPEPGEQLEGEFYKDKKDNWKFRKASKPAGSFGGSGASSGPYMKPQPPDAVARMGESAAHGHALTALTLACHPQDGDWDLLKQAIAEWTDWFTDRVDKAGQAAKQGADKSEGAGPLPSPSPASRPSQPPQDDTQQWLTKLLEDAALNPDASHKLAGFIATRFKPEQIKKAENGLQDPELQAQTLKDLEQALRLTTGEILPAEAETSDFPF